jgi:hypothetical protein
MPITVDQFLERTKRRITVPSNQVLLQNEDMLEMADSALRERVIPLILSVNQNYFVYDHREPLLDGKDSYAIPERAIGRGLRDIKLENGSDRAITHMSLIALEDAHRLNVKGVPTSFHFRGDKIVVSPSPAGNSMTLLMSYDMQHSQLCLTTEAAKVVSVSGAVITCDAIPANITDANLIDVIDGKAGHSAIGMDLKPIAVTGTEITLEDAELVPAGIKAGDYVSIAKRTPVLMVPMEAEPLLQIHTAEQILYAVGDFEGAQLIASRAMAVEENLKKMLAPRIEGVSTKIINRSGLLRGRGLYNRNRNRSGYYG